jgi:hypothetical protein
MYSLSQRFARSGISLMMTHESIELFRLTRLSEIGISHVADNVVMLQYLRIESQVKRALLVTENQSQRTPTRNTGVSHPTRRHCPRRTFPRRSTVRINTCLSDRLERVWLPADEKRHVHHWTLELPDNCFHPHDLALVVNVFTHSRNRAHWPRVDGHIVDLETDRSHEATVLPDVIEQCLTAFLDPLASKPLSRRQRLVRHRRDEVIRTRRNAARGRTRRNADLRVVSELDFASARPRRIRSPRGHPNPPTALVGVPTARSATPAASTSSSRCNSGSRRASS